MSPADSDTDNGQLRVWLRICGRDWLAPVVLLVVCLSLYLPGLFAVPPLDRDEPRFAQASKQMMESGNYVTIHYQDQARNKKPIGIYWMQVGAAKLLGYGETAPIWVFRLPSVFGAVIAVLLSYWAARAFFAEPASFVAALLVALALILNVEARLAKTDAVLLACVVLSQGALARVWMAQQKRAVWSTALLFWVGLGLGTLIKGPIILLVCGLTILFLSIWDKRISWLRGLAPVTGSLLYILIVAPWLVVVHIESDGAFFRDALGGDLWAKVGSGRQSHGAPPLTHFLAMFLIFWPIPSFFLVIFKRIRQKLNLNCYRFLLCWLIPPWIIFELVSTKLPHYTMPMMPALALLVGGLLVQETHKPAGLYVRYTAMFLLVLVPLAIAVGVIVGPVLLDLWPSPPAAVLCGLAVIMAVSAAHKFVRSKPLEAMPSVYASAVLMFVGFWMFAVPALTKVWISPKLVEAVSSIAKCGSTEVASAGFNEPSFVFLQGTQTQLLSAEKAARFLAAGVQGAALSEGTCRVALVEGRQLDRFDAEVLQLGLKTSEAPSVSGININGGKTLLVHIFYVGGATQ
ncbi:glycosyltransferase family 39 protein [Pseudovibrio sp. Tun.PSC04-5.I4]|uniref:ArnT family glycosyltransferase n=1 Tax=Pseudovibrio sp. Tun.PSC04-5.I4 TaxID=1798213 RepID=UPI000880B147|nr:glycosyltransferase family 39 protein [Pseudovibrio sp. Tun.PSC04-5.I4]SDR11761.1 4-amino-4-deoxy-L-arabinose transferase [Pseudovibrio sp. Tun.PSC04-5.I4]